MENRAAPSLADHYAAAIDWWRGAGVDCDFVDEAENWLAEPEQAAPVQSPEAPAAAVEVPHEPAIRQADLPDDLAQFRVWWTDPASPLPAGPGPRVAPRGEAGAALMLLSTMPEESDADTLFGGVHGALLANICRALGVVPDDAYFASALPCHLPHPDWDSARAEGLGSALSHHVALARPQKVILFGNDLPPLLGADEGAPEAFRAIGDLPVLTTFAPDKLLGHARQRARLWHRLLEWTAK